MCSTSTSTTCGTGIWRTCSTVWIWNMDRHLDDVLHLNIDDLRDRDLANLLDGLDLEHGPAPGRCAPPQHRRPAGPGSGEPARRSGSR